MNGTKILHLIDPTTPDEALEMLALLLASGGAMRHRVLALGHDLVRQRAILSGVPQNSLQFKHALGWADPTGWRAVRQALRAEGSTHLHAWGLWGMVAGTVQRGFSGRRVATFTVAPEGRQIRVLRTVCRRKNWVITCGSTCVQQALIAAGVPTEQCVQVRPGIALDSTGSAEREEIRSRLGIAADDYPMIWMGGDAGHASRPDHAIWAAAIVQQIFPRTRVILRLPFGAAAPSLLLREFAEAIAIPEMLAYAPAEMRWSEIALAADVFLSTPEGPTGTGPLLHALAAGVPVIAAATPEVMELVEDKVTAILAPPGKPRWVAGRFEGLLTDATLRATLTANARQKIAEDFAPQRMLDALVEVYEASVITTV